MKPKPKRKETAMSDISVPDDRREEYERHVAILVNVQHARDEAIREREETLAHNDRLRADISALNAQIESLRGMMKFAEDQARLREAQEANRVLTYQNQRDEAVAEVAKLEAALSTIANVVLAQVRERGATIHDKENGKAPLHMISHPV